MRSQLRTVLQNLLLSVMAALLILPLGISNYHAQRETLLRSNAIELRRAFERFSSDMKNLEHSIRSIQNNQEYQKIRRVAKNYGTKDYFVFTKFVEHLRSVFIPYNEIIKDYTLAFENSDLQFSKTRIYLQGQSIYPDYLAYDNMDKKLYKASIFPEENSDSSIARELVSLSRREEQESLRYIQYLSTSPNNRVAMELIIDLPAVCENYFASFVDETSAWVLLYNGEVLANSPNTEVDQDFNFETYGEGNEIVNGITQYSIDEQVLFISTANHVPYQLILLRNESYYASNIFNIFKFLLIYIFIAFILMTLAVHIWAYLQSKPWRKLIRLIKGEKAKTPRLMTSYDYEIVHDYFVNSMKEKNMLVANYEQIEKRNEELYFTVLLLQSQEWTEAHPLLKRLPEPYFMITIQLKMDVYDVVNQLENQLENTLNLLQVEYYSQKVTNSQIVMLLDASWKRNDFMEHFVSVLEQSVGDKYFLATSAKQNALRDLSESYQETVYALHFRQTHKTVYDFGQMKLQSKQHFLPERWQNHLQEALLIANTESFEEQIRTYTNAIIANEPDPKLLQLIYAEISSVLLKVCAKHKISLDPNALEVIDFSHSLQQVMQQFKEYGISVCETIVEQKKSHNIALRNAIITYIENNFSREDMYAASVAEKFDISEKYLTSFVREQTGYGFAEYVEKLRLQEARKLIMENEYTIKEIGEMIGYNNQSTFYKSYKRVYGESPGKLRTTGL